MKQTKPCNDPPLVLLTQLAKGCGGAGPAGRLPNTFGSKNQHLPLGSPTQPVPPPAGNGSECPLGLKHQQLRLSREATKPSFRG